MDADRRHGPRTRAQRSVASLVTLFVACGCDRPVPPVARARPAAPSGGASAAASPDLTVLGWRTRAERLLGPIAGAAGFGLTVSGHGAVLRLLGDRCDRRQVEAFLLRLSNDPVALDACFRADYHAVQCLSDDLVAVEMEMPPAGSRVPGDVAWHEAFATTPVGHPRGPERTWCFEATTRTERVHCARTQEACAAARDAMTARGIAADHCQNTEQLWCFPTQGFSRRCALARAGCDSLRERGGPTAGPCSARYPM